MWLTLRITATLPIVLSFPFLERFLLNWCSEIAQNRQNAKTLAQMASHASKQDICRGRAAASQHSRSFDVAAGRLSHTHLLSLLDLIRLTEGS